MGRPTSFTEALADLICEKLIEGVSLRKICGAAKMPAASTVCRWLASNETFREQYAHAREMQADTLADESVYIADTPKMGVTVTTKGVMIAGDDGPVAGVETRTKRGDMLGHRRLQCDARRWYAAKLNPKKYGDKLDLNASVVFSRPSSEVMGDEEWGAEFGAQG